MVIKGQLYFAGGSNTSINEAYSLKTESWTTLASMPDAIVLPGSALVGGRLYCIGGSDNGTIFQGSVYDSVQIYQP
jgi:N-acetylneuraminic acid mutarotase